ncbi:MAG: desulfurase [Sphingomonadales bacterium]|nr:desulfurase [Sphingomonadales bacterium]
MSKSPQIWFSRSQVVSPLAVAVQTGKLQEAFSGLGIELQSTTDNADPDIRRSYFDHSIPWSFRQGGSLPALWARSNGAASRLIGLSWNNEFQAIITLQSTGIKSAKDLDGRRFAIPHFSPLGVDLSAPFALKGLLSARATEGLDTSGIELVDVAAAGREGTSPLGGFALGPLQPLPAEAIALLRNEVDAIYVKGVEGVRVANAIRASIVTEFSAHPDPWIRLGAGNPRPLTIGSLFAEERPDLVTLLLTTLGQIAPWAAQNPEAAVGALAEIHQSSKQAVRAALGPDIGKHLTVTLKDEELLLLERYKRQLLDWNILTNDFSISDWVAS